MPRAPRRYVGAGGGARTAAQRIVPAAALLLLVGCYAVYVLSHAPELTERGAITFHGVLPRRGNRDGGEHEPICVG